MTTGHSNPNFRRSPSPIGCSTVTAASAGRFFDLTTGWDLFDCLSYCAVNQPILHHCMDSTATTRRDFLKKSIAGGLGLAAGWRTATLGSTAYADDNGYTATI